MILFMRHSYQRVEHFPAQFEQMECESCSGYILKNLVEYILKKKKKSSDANKFNFTNVFEHYVGASPLYSDMGINPFNKGRHRETIKSSQLGVICVTLDCTSNHLSNETQTHTQMWDKSTGSGTRKRSLLCRSSRR